MTLTEGGTDRYGLLAGFNNPSNGGQGTRGIAEYSPVGLPVLVTRMSVPAGIFSSIGDDRYDYCFAAGTLVLMADGGRKAIEKIEAGEMVLAVPDTDPEAEPRACRVLEVYHNAPARLLAVTFAAPGDVSGGETVLATAEHPFYANGDGWTRAANLRPGKRLRMPDGAWATVRGTANTGRTEPVFNLRVDGCRTYFASGSAFGPAALVHNLSPTPTAPPAPAPQPSAPAGTSGAPAPASAGTQGPSPAQSAAAAQTAAAIACRGALDFLRAQSAGNEYAARIGALRQIAYEVNHGLLTQQQGDDLLNNMSTVSAHGVNGHNPSAVQASPAWVAWHNALLNANAAAKAAAAAQALQAAAMQGLDHNSDLSPAQVAALNANSSGGAGSPPTPPATSQPSTQPSGANGSNPFLAGKTPWAGTRSTGVSRARALEVKLVQATGAGTVDWTPQEIAYIKTTGKLPPGIVGHHINSVVPNDEWAGDPRNIRLVRGQPENLEEHDGNFRNPTTGPLIDRQAMIDNPTGAK